MTDEPDRDYSPDELGPVCPRCKAPLGRSRWTMPGRPLPCMRCCEENGSRKDDWQSREHREIHDLVIERLALMTEQERCAYLERLIERSKATLAKTKEQLHG